MTDISAHVYKDGDKFYFDPENYSGDISKNLTIDYEDGDMIKWVWEDTKMSGILREEGHNVKLFSIDKVVVLK